MVGWSMPSEQHVSEARALLGKSYDEDEVPAYPGRIYWYDGGFLTGFPHAPMRIIEVRFREAWNTEGGDFTVHESRAVDTSEPEDVYGEWYRHYMGTGAEPSPEPKEVRK